jgi:hypothetical protein
MEGGLQGIKGSLKGFKGLWRERRQRGGRGEPASETAPANTASGLSPNTLAAIFLCVLVALHCFQELVKPTHALIVA